MLRPEYGQSYGGLLAHFNTVETNMQYRRQEISELKPQPDNENEAARSLYFSDEAIFAEHPRLKTMTQNIRQQRSEKVNSLLTVFKDENEIIAVEGSPADKPGTILVEAIGLGMGFCYLQLKFLVFLQFRNWIS